MIKPNKKVTLNDTQTTNVSDIKAPVQNTETKNTFKIIGVVLYCKQHIRLLLCVLAGVVLCVGTCLIVHKLNNKLSVEEEPKETTAQITTMSAQESSVTMSDEEFFEYLLHGTNGTEQAPVEQKENIFYEIDRDVVFGNENAIGYINIDGTDVSYTVVQADDNAYYLDKDEYGNSSESGAIFGDYRNNFSQLDRNNVIYGHNMASGKMFGTLTKMLSEDFYTEGTDTYIQFNSKYYNNVFCVYSVYEIDLTTFNYIQTGFADDAEFRQFIETTQQFNTVQALNAVQVPEDTRLLTLSTCVEGGKKRLVVHGYLYAREVF